ncbi:hypothetical protein [Alkalihalobacillus deserti]|uniref:hypothetical protein n=1 Tax=Alkalihalobacillus deserti TaxID=2879466 RepID=UPI001D144BDC|nr:hypothetical protein [Alkalihalobacillus deserti]
MWRKILLILFICFLVVPSVESRTEQIDQTKKILALVVPGLSFNEVEWLIHNDDSSIWKEASFGAMNVRADGPYSYLNNMVTIGAGAKAVGVQGWNSFELSEEINGFEAREWMYQLTGSRPEEGLIHPDFHRLEVKNRETTHKGEVGFFGETLQEHDIARVVYGHSDTLEEKVRYGSLLAIDQKGFVNGQLQDAVQEKTGAPYGIEMNADFLINKLSTNVETRDQFIVIEWGDIYRLYDQHTYMENLHFEAEQKRQLKRMSAFLTRARKEVDDIWLIAPMMNKQAYDERKQLAPVFHWGEEMGGFLTSTTTKQDYLVSSLDLIPTFLASFNIQETEFSGNVIKHSNNGIVDKAPVVKRVNEIVLIYKSRASVLSIYISCLVIALIGAAIYGFFGSKKRQTWRYVTRLILLSALWSPFWFLALAGVVNKLGVTGFVLTLIVGSFICGYIVERTARYPIFWVGTLTFLLITIDVMIGSPLMQRSYLGYDPIIGARYYGIGNEFAGVYLISAMMLLHPILTHLHRGLRITCIVTMLFLLTIVLGKNTLGTNAGATLSAGLAFAFLCYRSVFQTWSWRLLLLLFGGVLSALFLLLYVLQLTGDQTHIGLAFERLLSGDFLYIKDTIERKLAMNWKIFKHSNWTQLFVTSYLLGAVILWRKRLQLGEQGKQLFLQTGVISSFALLLLNDSGVVAAATSMFCVVSAHYYWLSVSKEENEFVIGKTINPGQTVED